jgi:hypothetical protein
VRIAEKQLLEPRALFLLDDFASYGKPFGPDKE